MVSADQAPASQKHGFWVGVYVLPALLLFALGLVAGVLLWPLVKGAKAGYSIVDDWSEWR